MFIARPFCLALLSLIAIQSAQGDESSTRDEAIAALKRAAEFYRGSVARHGGYVYYYSLDLKKRWGEGEAGPDQIWVQPPGTPTVGLAYLRAYEATRDQFYLDAATEAAEALIYGQLKSGGWQNAIHFDPTATEDAYRNGKGDGKRNNSTLDDGATQAALRLMMQVDQAHDFKHVAIHESARVALDSLLAAQFPNGAFPQVWSGPVDQSLKVRRAQYPDYDWRTEGRVKDYWNMYTLNDGLAGTVAQTLIEAHHIYSDPRLLVALKQLGNFLVLAQMPNPQPAWAQQYDYEMHPIWARKFEPPAVTGGESQDVLKTLIMIYRATGDEKYLRPIPAALAYLKSSTIDGGQKLARYYELKTNRPLYMSRQGDIYSLTYDDSNLPDHYGWKVDSKLDTIADEYDRAQSNRGDATASPRDVSSKEVRQILTTLNDEGRWISTATGERLVGQPKFKPGDQYLSSQVFSQNVTKLSQYLAAAHKP